MIEVAVETDDVHAVIGKYIFPSVGTNSARMSCESFGGSASSSVLSFRDVANGEYADAVNFRWLKSAKAVSKDPFEALFA
jgi:hypothetical protein